MSNFFNPGYAEVFTIIIDIKQTASGGWLSRLWRRGDTPAPIKANLGDQTTFYYDKDLKRWVNKNVGIFELMFFVLLF